VATDAFTHRFSELTEASPARRRDAVLRALDILLSAFFLLVTLPLSLPIAALILVTSGRPLFYRGDRVGRGGHVFEMLKFRTLERGAEERLGPYLGEELVHRTQAETTRAGAWLRKTQLDEIPQLINVLKGDMSLVGPRPALPAEVAAFDEELRDRTKVKPGITGLWQIEARDNPSFSAYRRLDLYYVENWSVSLDIVILFATVEHVITRFVTALLGRR